MATAVREIEIGSIPPELAGLDGYEHALILVRIDGRPMSRIELPVIDGRITRSALESAFDPTLRWEHDKARLGKLLGVAARKCRPLPKATVAICTRDRPEDLDRCLRGVLNLRDVGHEVLVVDNCPSDDRSREVVARFPSVQYVREPVPGLNPARNRALAGARGEIVAFIDDDATPDPEWLSELLNNFDGPNVMCVTGLTMPLTLDTAAQEAFESYSTFSRGFSRRVYDGFINDPLFVGDIGSGTNMAVRRTVLETLGGFDDALDAGTPTQSGGDHEMYTRILAAGYRIVYEPAALNWHRHRRSHEELVRTIYGYGVGVYSALLRSLVVEREIGVISVAWLWFRHQQAPRLVGALRRRPWAPPRELILAELRGCLSAASAYRKSVKRVRARAKARQP